MQSRANVVKRVLAVVAVVSGMTVGTGAVATGAGAAAPLFLISPTSLDFGAQPLNSPSAQQRVTIKNISGAPIVMSGAGGGAGIFGGSQDCENRTIAANASCHMYYQFTPTALGAATGSTGGNWNGQTFSFHFTGTGTPRFRISPTAFAFGDVTVGTTSAQQLVTITNLGGTSIVMSGAGGGAGIFGGSQDCQGLTIAAGHSCHMYYQFHPTVIGAATGSTGGNWNGQTFSFSFTGNGTAAPTGDYVPLTATRVLNTASNVGYFGAKPIANQIVSLFVGGNSIPANAVAADLTVATASEAGNGTLKIWPCGATKPAVATLTFKKSVTISNHVNAPLGTNGAVCLEASAATHIVADVDGYYPSTSGFHPLAANRVLSTLTHVHYTGGKPAAGKVIELKVTGAAVPTSAAAVALNVAVTQATSGGGLIVWPCGVSRPTAQTLTYRKTATIEAAALSKVGTGGKVCIRASKSAHIIADLTGWYAAATTFTPVRPQRVADTRGHAKPGAGHVSTIRVTGVGAANIPANARAVVVDITPLAEAASGRLTLFPCGAVAPATEVVTYTKNVPITDLAMGAIGTNGSICLRTSASAHFVVDVVGWYGA